MIAPEAAPALPSIRLALTELLEAGRHHTKAAERAPAALDALEAGAWDVVLSDLRIPTMDGLKLLVQVLSRHPGVIFALVTAHDDERTAVRALHQASRRAARSFVALERHDGNISRAAGALGLHRQSLQRLLRKASLRGPGPG